MYPVSANSEQNLFDHETDGNNQHFVIIGSGTLQWANYHSSAYQWYINTGLNAFSLNTWVHIALVRNGSSEKIYVNGVQVGTIGTSSAAVNNYAGPLKIGTGPYGNNFIGYLSEFRITKGVARYTSNFTPPNAPYYWWSWGCNGTNGGSNVTCGANKYE
jgi:hypothetical protein